MIGNVHLNHQAWIFRGRKCKSLKFYLTFTQIFESFLKVEKTQPFLEKTLINFPTQTKKKKDSNQISNLYNVDKAFKSNFVNRLQGLGLLV